MRRKARFLVFSWCLVWAFVINDVMALQLGVPEQLGMIPWFIEGLPLIAAGLIFLVLVVGWSRREGAWLIYFWKNWLILRVILVLIVFWLVMQVGNYYSEAHLGKIAVKDGTMDKVDWEKMEAQAGFRLIDRLATGQNETVWFVEGPGREEKVRALLGNAQLER